MGNVYWFNPTTGSSGNTGLSKASPKATVTQCEALATLNNGDIAVCVAGTHTLTASDNPQLIKLAGIYGENAYLTPDNPQPATCVIDGNSTYTWYLQHRQANMTKTVCGLTWKKNPSPASSIPFDINFSLSNCTFLFRNCVFDSFLCPTGGAYGLFSTSSTAGIFRVEACTFSNMASSTPSTLFANGSGLGAGTTWLVYNNTFYFNSGTPYNSTYGVATIAGGNNCTVDFRNNIFFNDTSATFYLAWNNNKSGTTLIEMNNIYYNNAGGTINLSGYTTTDFATKTQTANTNADPMFYDKAGGDFRILPASTIHDLGTIIA